MKVFILIRIVSVVTLLYFAGHIAGYPWTPGQTDGARNVINEMRSVTFEAEGHSRTYMDFYIGFGHTISILLLLATVTIWLVGNLSKQHASAARPLLLCLAIAFAADGVVSFVYFFAIPVILASVIAVMLFIAFILLKPSNVLAPHH